MKPSARLEVRVIPRARRTAVDGMRAGRLLIRVVAPPVDQAANDAVVAVLAKILSVPRVAIQIVAGERARDKSIVVAGLTAEELRRRLAPIAGS